MLSIIKSLGYGSQPVGFFTSGTLGCVEHLLGIEESAKIKVRPNIYTSSTKPDLLFLQYGQIWPLEFMSEHKQ